MAGDRNRNRNRYYGAQPLTAHLKQAMFAMRIVNYGEKKLIGWSYCSGIGAPEVAAPEIDWRVACEIDQAACEVLQVRHGHVPISHAKPGDRVLFDRPGGLGDISIDEYRNLGLEWPDLIVAGTPCQAFSVAGLRNGLTDERGNVTLDFANHVREIYLAARSDGKPEPGLLWENVPGALSDRTNAFGCFLGALIGADDPLVPPEAEWGWCPETEPERLLLGNGGTYGWKRISWPSAGMVSGPWARAAWRVLDAQYFGHAQRRRRLFVVADFGGGPDPARILFERRGVPRLGGASRSAGPETAGTPRGDASGGRITGPITARLGDSNPDAADAISGMLVAGHHGDVAGTVSSKWQKGSGGPAGDETQNMVVAPISAPLSAATGRRAPGTVPDELESLLCAPLAPTLRAGKNETGGDRPPGTDVDTIESLISVITMRGRDGHNVPEVEESGVAPALRGSDGGSSHPLVAFTAKDHGQDVGELSPTLRAMEYANSWANGGGQVAVAIPGGEPSISVKGGSPDEDGARAMMAQLIAIFTADGRLADALTENEQKTYSAEGVNFRLRNCIAFSTAQITHPENRTNPLPGEPAPTLASHGNPAAVAFKASHYTRGKDGKPSEIAPALSADADRGDQDTLLAHQVGIRKLTPTECERLQGFPDGFTNIGAKWVRHTPGMAAYLALHGCAIELRKWKPPSSDEPEWWWYVKTSSDSARYRQLGNSMAVRNIRWLLMRIMEDRHEQTQRSAE